MGIQPALPENTAAQMEDRRHSFNYEDLIACGARRDVRPRQRPAAAAADADVRPHHRDHATRAASTARATSRPSSTSIRDLWFFDCHFLGDPVMPGCLGLDACGSWSASSSAGSAARPAAARSDVGEVKFAGEVLPTIKMVTYEIDMKRVINPQLVVGIGDGWLAADGSLIYTANDLQVGLFKQDRLAAERRLSQGLERPIKAQIDPRQRQSGHASRRRHRHRHRLVHRRQRPRSARRLARGQVRHRAAPEYAELGFRCQVHGKPHSTGKAWSTAARRASSPTALATTTSPWSRRSPTPA